MGKMKKYKYRCRGYYIVVETYLETTNFIMVCSNKTDRDFMSAVSDSEQLFDEDYQEGLTYIKSKTVRRWFHKVYREIKRIKYNKE